MIQLLKFISNVVTDACLENSEWGVVIGEWGKDDRKRLFAGQPVALTLGFATLTLRVVIL